MKYCFTVSILFFALQSQAQKPAFIARNLSLPPELSYYDNQFSGLYIHEGKLFFMSESRLEDAAEGKLYAVSLADIDKKLADTSYVLPYKKYHLYNLEILREKMNAAGQEYEGLEAIVMDGKNIFLSVETTTPSSDCILLKGILTDSSVILDKDYVSLPKPVKKDGSHIYNAGFETMTMLNKKPTVFFEYNYFPEGNYAYALKAFVPGKKAVTKKIPFDKLPFRITDITQTSINHFTAINFFYKGDGKDTVYRVPYFDKLNDSLTRNKTGHHNYCRLIDLTYTRKKFTWKPIWELPEPYLNFNWEGIASYKSGYFIMNDKYTLARPYFSTLLYLQKK